MASIHEQVDELLADVEMLGAELAEQVLRFQASYTMYCLYCRTPAVFEVTFDKDQCAAWVDFRVSSGIERVMFSAEKRCDCEG